MLNYQQSRGTASPRRRNDALILGAHLKSFAMDCLEIPEGMRRNLYHVISLDLLFHSDEAFLFPSWHVPLISGYAYLPRGLS